MQKIINVKKFNYDCCDNHFYFISDDAIIDFYQALNCDLLFSVFNFNNLSNVSFIVSEKDFKEVYDLIDEMLNEIHSRKDILGYNNLFEKGFFSWQSDAPANEDAWNNSFFIYNYFNIIPMHSAYKLEFVNNTNKPRFSVEVNTDRSRYDRIRFDVWDFYKKLEKVCPLVDKNVLNEIVKKMTLNRKTIDINPLEYGRIVCAALFHNNCIYMGKEGHHVIFPMEPMGFLRGAKQGFVTENGYFVDRKTGLYIARYFDQINIKHNPQDELLSEDLKKENIKVLKHIMDYSYKEK